MGKHLIILCGVSGSGKTTLAQEIVSRNGYDELITSTERPMRPGEEDGLDYYFYEKGELDKSGRLIERVEYSGHVYGIREEDFLRTFESDKVVAVLTSDGIQEVKSYIDSEGLDIKVDVVYLDLGDGVEDQIRSRLAFRGDSAETIQSRIKELNDTGEVFRLEEVADFYVDATQSVSGVYAEITHVLGL